MLQRRFAELSINETAFLLRGLQSLPLCKAALKKALVRNNPFIHDIDEYVYIDQRAFPAVYADATMYNKQVDINQETEG